MRIRGLLMTPVSYSADGMGNGSHMVANADHEAIARSFIEARRARRALTEYPGTRPESLASAYAIQDKAIEFDGRLVGGWKVGRIWAPTDTVLGANRLAGPIFADTIVDAADGHVPSMSVFDDGFAAGEAEFMVRLAPRPGGSLPLTDAETLLWIDEVRIGIEIASSPYPRINEDGPCVTVSDQGNNAGLVLGAAVPPGEWAKLHDIEISAFVDELEVARKTAAEMLDGPLGAVRFLLSNLAARDIEAAEGTWISSGAVTGVHPVRPGQTVRAEFAEFGKVSCSIRAY